MTAGERISAARRVVILAVAARVLLTGLAATTGVVALASLLDLAVAIPPGLRTSVPLAALLAGLLSALPIMRRARVVRSDQAMALWIEHQQPMDYLLVTSIEHPDLGERVEQLDFQPAVRRAALRGTQRPALAAIALLAALLLVPAGSVRRVLAPRPGDALIRPVTSARRSRLRPLVFTYTPPEYIRANGTTVEDPETVRGIEGGTVEVRGRGAAAGLRVALGPGAGSPVGASAGGEWRAEFPMPRAPTVFRVSDGVAGRIIAIEPIRDSLPTVSLIAPARDTVVRAAGGKLPLRATMTDDFGLADTWFEYIATSGSGELFQFRTGRLGGWAAERLSDSRAESLQSVLNLDSLHLGPGAVLHVRAVARDFGPASRGVGASETRTYRVLRPNDLDTARVVALPSIPGDTNALSERLLIRLTEALEARRPRLKREVLLEESRSISRDQARLRRMVSDIIFMRLSGQSSGEERQGAEERDSALTPDALLAAAEAATGAGDTAALDYADDESPVVAINRPLLEAYNAMWDATRELDVAALTRALPHMYTALDAIQRARAAERVYLRAPAQKGVVNLAGVRLTGRRDGVVVTRRIGGPVDRRIEWLARLLANAGKRDSLLVLRIELLPDVPAAAAALSDAIVALRSSADANPALNAARKALVDPPVRRSAGPPSPWGGSW